MTAGKRKLLYTVPETAEMLGLGKSKVWELVMAGEIDSILIGRARRVNRAAIDSFIEELEREADE